MHKGFHRRGRTVPYIQCPVCAANLDPGEICWDCHRKAKKAASGGNDTESGTGNTSTCIVSGSEGKVK